VRGKLLLINGPNLNLLGTREPHLYGSDTLADVVDRATTAARDAGFELIAVQSNHEGELIDAVHAAREECDAIIVNAGAFTHTSIALRDALAAADLPFAEVHLTNVHAREPFRHHSYLADLASCVIAGAGVRGYEFAVSHLAEVITQRARTAQDS